jgi:hypothetical protein
MLRFCQKYIDFKTKRGKAAAESAISARKQIRMANVNYSFIKSSQLGTPIDFTLLLQSPSIIFSKQAALA